MHGRLPSAYLGSLCLGFILFFFFFPNPFHIKTQKSGTTVAVLVCEEENCATQTTDCWLIFWKFTSKQHYLNFTHLLLISESIIQIQLTGATLAHGALPCFLFFYSRLTHPLKKSTAVSKCTKALRRSSFVCSREEALALRFNVSKLKSQKNNPKSITCLLGINKGRPEPFILNLTEPIWVCPEEKGRQHHPGRQLRPSYVFDA